MKKKNLLKIAVLIIAVVLISLISFVGIYKNDKGAMQNIMKEYTMGKDLKGSRLVELEVDTSTKDDETAKADEEKEESEETEKSEETEESEKTQVPVNPQEVLTKENFEKSKIIIEERLKSLKVTDYDLRVDETSGTILMDMPEGTQTDEIMQYVIQPGDFSMIATDTNEVLLSKENIKTSKIMYSSTENGTTVYLDIEFNKDSVKTLEDITKEYVETEAEDGTKTKKTISLKIDDETLLTTYFGETISNGSIQISTGEATTDIETINKNVKNATYLSTLLNGDTLPVVYTIKTNQFISAVVDKATIQSIVIVLAVILAIVMIYLLVKFDLKGIIAGISFIGYIAVLMLLIRFTNVALTVGSIVAIVLSSVVTLLCIVKLLNKKSSKEFNKAFLHILVAGIPLFVVALVCCFMASLPIISFGTALFWGLALNAAYDGLLIRKIVLDNK